MTPEQLELVSSTLADVETRSDAFSACFYEQLFASAPETRVLFGDEIDEQRDKLVAELLFLAGAVCDLPTFVERARDLGARHHRYGVRPGHYEVVEQAFLAALADALGAAWNETTLLAWQRLYRLMAETMLEGSCGPAFVGTAVSPPESGS
jgi:hemoglobin-like flavoprotein